MRCPATAKASGLLLSVVLVFFSASGIAQSSADFSGLIERVEILRDLHASVFEITGEEGEREQMALYDAILEQARNADNLDEGQRAQLVIMQYGMMEYSVTHLRQEAELLKAFAIQGHMENQAADQERLALLEQEGDYGYQEEMDRVSELRTKWGEEADNELQDMRDLMDQLRMEISQIMRSIMPTIESRKKCQERFLLRMYEVLYNQRHLQEREAVELRLKYRDILSQDEDAVRAFVDC